MAKKTTKSSFLERVTEAHETHKSDETRIGAGGSLPAGIEHGVARLVDVRIGTYGKGNNEGEPFFMAAGTILDPESVTVTEIDPVTKKAKKPRIIHVRGLRTQIGPEPICDTTNADGKEVPLADHWDRVLNHLRLLGIDTKTTEPTDIVAETEDGKYGAGPVLEALMEAGPTFRFRTWQGKPTPQYPNPRINEEWRGVCEYEGDATAEDVQDDSAAEPKWESDAEADAAKEPEKVPAKTTKPAVEEPAEEPDYLALAKLADAGKPKKEADEAKRALAGHAKLLNIEGFEEMDTWTQVAEAILAQSEEEPEEQEEEYQPEEEPEEWAPQEGEVAYMSNGPKKAPTECEVVKLYPKSQKADVKRLDTKKIVKGVPYDKIGPNETPF